MPQYTTATHGVADAHETSVNEAASGVCFQDALPGTVWSESSRRVFNYCHTQTRGRAGSGCNARILAKALQEPAPPFRSLVWNSVLAVSPITSIP